MPRVSYIVALTALVCASTSAGWGALRAGDALSAFSINPLEFSEDDALDRFEIDEWFLPKLNVELPALFDWGAADNAYYAQARYEAGERTIDLC